VVLPVLLVQADSNLSAYGDWHLELGVWRASLGGGLVGSYGGHVGGDLGWAWLPGTHLAFALVLEVK